MGKAVENLFFTLWSILTGSINMQNLKEGESLKKIGNIASWAEAVHLGTA